MRAGLPTTGYMNSLHPVPDCQFVAFLTAPRRMLPHLLQLLATGQAATGLIKPVSQRSPARKVQFRAREARGRICISRHPTRPGFICILGTERTRFASWPQSLQYTYTLHLSKTIWRFTGSKTRWGSRCNETRWRSRGSKTRWRSRGSKTRWRSRGSS